MSGVIESPLLIRDQIIDRSSTRTFSINGCYFQLLSFLEDESRQVYFHPHQSYMKMMKVSLTFNGQLNSACCLLGYVVLSSDVLAAFIGSQDITRHHCEDNPEHDIATETGNLSYGIAALDKDRQKIWELNYKEATIFLQEGKNNDKFSTHPRNQEALPAYELTHNKWFYLLDFLAALLLVILAIMERPAVPGFEVPIGVHGSLELFGLAILGLELGIRMKWLKFKVYLKHKRTMMKSVTLCIMVVEAIVVLVRNTNHFRVTRALRPLFLIDTHYCQGVRRICRQLLQSLPPILDMLALLLFFMLIFSILGFYLFSPLKEDTYFTTIQDSFISLFILLTTANYPDVMMPAYSVSRWNSAFFIVYLSIELYFLMNLLLAVVYDTFSDLEKKKLRKLFFHKRKACLYAFKLLVTKYNHTILSVRHFGGMMKYFAPGKTRRDYYLMFKYLNTSKSGGLSLEEFYEIYQVESLQWRLKNEDTVWSSKFKNPFNRIFKAIHWFVTWKPFEIFIYIVISSNFLWILVETIKLSEKSLAVRSYDFQDTWFSIVFVSIYAIEATLKILGHGPVQYFTSGWDIFDFLVTIVSLIGILGNIFADNFYYVTVLRPFRLLRLLKVKRRYRDVLGTLFLLFVRLTSLAVMIVFVYYFFAVIGIEVFLNVDLKNCCKNTSVESFYRYDNGSLTQGYYYLNTFDNILTSSVTLFELTVVNNWFIIMEGFAHHVGQWSRIYFMLFFIVMMVVMTTVVAFVLEAFIFRIQYRKTMKTDDMDGDAMFKVDVPLSEEEMHMCCEETAPFTGQHIPNQTGVIDAFVFRGERIQNKNDFSLKMYADEVKNWIEEEAAKRSEIVQSMEEMRQRVRANADDTESNSGTSLA